ncbi:hypothetical protein ABIE13_002569 [Ottowia thiooxydans]|uniref:Uncharacterized protein n=1 Tax=Ottowia thiooxydans TaxID=219182 RepID=A0ABV2Q9A4_9BURK
MMRESTRQGEFPMALADSVLKGLGDAVLKLGQ